VHQRCCRIDVPASDTRPSCGSKFKLRQYRLPAPLARGHQAGFKSPKQIIAMEVTNRYPGGYWEDRRYN
jgi:hypothetical protein